MEWASAPSPLCQKLGDAVTLDPVWQGKKPVDALDLDLHIFVSTSELGKSVFLVLLLDANAEFVAEPSDGQGRVACAGTMFGILDVGAWQPDHGVSWVNGSTIRGTWIEVRAVVAGDGLEEWAGRFWYPDVRMEEDTVLDGSPFSICRGICPSPYVLYDLVDGFLDGRVEFATSAATGGFWALLEQWRVLDDGLDRGFDESLPVVRALVGKDADPNRSCGDLIL